MSGTELKKLINDNIQNVIQSKKLEDYSGKIIAIDVISVILEFKRVLTLKDNNGNVTSHLKGLFERTIGLLEKGIKPVYVFDGKLPEFRTGSKKEYQLTPPYQNECNDAKTLLRYMGIPYIQAESEAGAKCSEMVRSNQAYCASTNILDALPFGTERLLLNLKLGKKSNLEEIRREAVLTGFNLSNDQFIDLCVLSGFYCDKIPGIGFKTAYKLIKKYQSVENIFLNEKQYTKPVNFDAACNLLKNSNCNGNFVKENPNYEDLQQFLCTEKNFKKETVLEKIEKLKETLKTTATKRKADQNTGNGETSKVKRPRLEKDLI